MNNVFTHRGKNAMFSALCGKKAILCSACVVKKAELGTENVMVQITVLK